MQPPNLKLIIIESPAVPIVLALLREPLLGASKIHEGIASSSFFSRIVAISKGFDVRAPKGALAFCS